MGELTGNEIPTNVSSCGNEVLLAFSSKYHVSSGYSGKIHVTDAPQRPEMGKSGCCETSCLCGANEGPCESNDQCKYGHGCIPDSCPSGLGLTNGSSCCQDISCGLADVKSGLLFSQNYPNNYNKWEYCLQQITVEPGKNIMVEFYSFDVSNTTMIRL